MAHSAHSASRSEYSYSHIEKKKDWCKREHQPLRNRLIQGKGGAD